MNDSLQYHVELYNYFILQSVANEHLLLFQSLKLRSASCCERVRGQYITHFKEIEYALVPPVIVVLFSDSAYPGE